MLKGAGLGLSSILAVSLVSLVNSYVFAEEPYEKQLAEGELKKRSLVEKIVGVEEAQAMPAMPMPALPIPMTVIKEIDVNLSFKEYINGASCSRYCEKKPIREDFEKVPIYRAYYAVEDKKDQFQEKIDKSINKGKWEDSAGIDKISTKFDDESMKLQVKLKEKKEKPKSILGRLLRLTVGSVDKIVGKADYDSDMIELRAVNEF